MAGLDEIIKRIPQSSFEKVSDDLVRLLLGSANADKVPEGLAKGILLSWECDELTKPSGLRTLLEASMIAEKDKTVALLQSLGIQL